jgi:hypothetical protein
MGFRNEIETEIEIDGAPEEVWGVLADLERYREWNPGFARASGRVEVGARLDLTFAQEGHEGMTMHPQVLVAEPGRELRWLGRLLGIPRLFDGEHRFEIQQVVPGHVRFVQGERFSGVLVPFLRKMIEVDTLSMFHRINEALAERVAAVRSLA